jgi:hypothetical protein
MMMIAHAHNASLMAVLESSYHAEENSESSTPNKMDPRQ